MEFKLHYWNYIHNYICQPELRLNQSINQTLKAVGFHQEIMHTTATHFHNQEALNPTAVAHLPNMAKY